MNAVRITEIALSLSRLRIERESGLQQRAEENQLREEQERELRQELIQFTVETTNS